MKTNLAFPFLLLLTLALPLRGEEDETTRLVTALGSPSSANRDSAETALQLRGAAVLDELFDAALGEDFEIARRARRLIVRLEAKAIPFLSRESASDTAKRAELARLLRGGLADRLIQRKLKELTDRIAKAADEKRLTDSEKRTWTSQLQSGQIQLSLSDSGELSLCNIERQLACREVLSEDALANKSIVPADQLEQFAGGKEVPAAYKDCWLNYATRVGDTTETRTLFTQMVSAEPALLAATSDSLAVDAAIENDITGRVAGGLFDLRTQQFVTEFRKGVKGRPEPGKPYPDVFDEATIARITTFLFVRSAIPQHVPTPTLSSITNALSTGMAGYFPSKQPFYELVRSGRDGRAIAIKKLFDAAVLTAVSGTDHERALQVAMFYRLRTPCRILAKRVLENYEDMTFDNDYKRASTLLLAGHAFLSFGKRQDDLPIVLEMLKDPEQVRLTGFRKQENRSFIELREMGLMATLKMLGKRPNDIGGTSKVTGYCPIKRFTKFDAIREPERWDDILKTVNGWLGDAKSDK